MTINGRPSRRVLAQRTAETQRGAFQLAVQVGSFLQMSFWARVRWFFTGKFDESLALRNAQALAQAQAEQAAAAVTKGAD